MQTITSFEAIIGTPVKYGILTVRKSIRLTNVERNKTKGGYNEAGDSFKGSVMDKKSIA